LRGSYLVACVGVRESIAAAVVVPRVDEDAMLAVTPESSVSRSLVTVGQRVIPRLYGDAEPSRPPNHAANELLLQLLEVQVQLASHAQRPRPESVSVDLVASYVDHRQRLNILRTNGNVTIGLVPLKYGIDDRCTRSDCVNGEGGAYDGDALPHIIQVLSQFVNNTNGSDMIHRQRPTGCWGFLRPPVVQKGPQMLFGSFPSFSHSNPFSVNKIVVVFCLFVCFVAFET